MSSKLYISDVALRTHLRRFRFEAGGMTQQELAGRVGVTRQTIHSIEKGRFRPSVELALRLAKVFDSSVEEMFELDDEEEERT